ncbi:MAG TPA: AtpZ/AtpI family protein [Candidatus Limnocylindria bacterium]|nr:AtpZ/AtpI family protein [Candidatus Limnocylindria bacterium]
MTDDGGRRRGGPTGDKPNWGLAFDLGLRLGISILIGLGGGLVVDNWLHTSPLFTLIGMVLGIGAAMVTIWNVAREAMRK